MRKWLPNIIVLIVAFLVATSALPRAQVTVAGVPTILSGFGNTPTIASSAGAGNFRVNVGTGGTAWSGIIGLPTVSNGWNCLLQNQLGGTTTKMTTSTTTGITVWNFGTGLLTTGWQAAEILVVHCAPY